MVNWNFSIALNLLTNDPMKANSDDSHEKQIQKLRCNSFKVF